jgi:hypothetical protein
MMKWYQSIIGVAAVVAALSIQTGTSAEASRKVEFISSDNKIDVTIGGVPFTSYVYGDEHSKPFLVPVRTPSGTELTRRYPLTAIPGGSDDHLHHMGIFFAVDKVNGVNFWNNTDVAFQIKHIATDRVSNGDGSGSLATRSLWIDASKVALLEEKRVMTFSAGEHEGEYAIDFSIDLTALVDQVVFKDIEEGMFAIRYTDWLREPDEGEGVRPGQPLPKESIAGTGRYFSSNGDETADGVWGKRARWVTIQGVHEGEVVGVAILNHPASFNYPTYWHARDYGLFSANPLAQGDFQRQDDYEKNDPVYLNHTLKKGESSHFRFKVILFDGTRTQNQIEKRFKNFAK